VRWTITMNKDTQYYRFMEVLPALLAWGTFVVCIICSIFLPIWVSIFIILFDIYWFLKTLYFTVFLRNGYGKMRKAMNTNWLTALNEDEKTKSEWESVYHLILFPMYKEQYEVVRETFLRLSRANYPVKKFVVVLGLEEKGGEEAQETGRKIQEEFKDAFLKILITTHPANLPGEKPGKSSNETWMAQCAQKEVIDVMNISYTKILASVFDVDTQIYPEYFGVLTHTFLTTPHPQRSSYQPVPFFLNNVFDAPALSRIIGFSGTFWQLMVQSTPEKLVTFSSHSMPFQALVDIGFWHKDIVSEDSRIFFQCLVHYNGDWRTVPLFYPVSMDANVGATFWETMKNLYKQQRRWAWGSENVAYLFSAFKENKKIPWTKKLFWKYQILEGFHSWATNSLVIFALGWLPILMGGENFRVTLLAYNLPSITQWIMTCTSLGIITTAILSIALLPEKPKTFRWWHYVYYVISWALMPISLTVFGAFPALEAQTRLAVSGKYRLDFWVTPKHRIEK